MSNIHTRITPFLWFDGKAEEAIEFYTSVFPNSKITTLKYWPEGGPFPKGWVQQGVFELDGLKLYAMDAGPQFKFTEAISLFVHCKDQSEIDYYWNKLTANGGEESMCGWLKDKYGLSWQIVPDSLGSMLGSNNADASARVGSALFKMRKIELAELEKAFRG